MRRSILLATLGLVATATLVGCSGSGDDDSGAQTEATTDEMTESAPSDEAESPSATGEWSA